MKNILFVGIIIALVAVIGFLVWDNTHSAKIYGNLLQKQDLIQVASPIYGSSVASPLKIRGFARGTWFFEASFPVKILDARGKELGVVPAQALTDWMTTEFVPFEATLGFETPTTKTGTLVLQKDNPSGLPENEDSLIVPVLFNI